MHIPEVLWGLLPKETLCAIPSNPRCCCCTDLLLKLLRLRLLLLVLTLLLLLLHHTRLAEKQRPRLPRPHSGKRTLAYCCCCCCCHGGPRQLQTFEEPSLCVLVLILLLLLLLLLFLRLLLLPLCLGPLRQPATTAAVATRRPSTA